MKKLLTNRRAKKAPPSRITNDTVAEHRERILEGGKRYKYPLQYTRNKLVINTIIISAVALVSLAVLAWWQLYVVQNSSAFFYRITQIVPLRVATVDGERARFSDYLLNYRTSEFYLKKHDEIRTESEDGQLQLQYVKREALDIALADALARKIARQNDISVDQKEVDQVLANLQSAANGQLSAETSDASLRRVLGLSHEDSETLVRNSILRSEAAFAIDDRASATAERAKELIDAHKGDLEKAAAQLNKERKNNAEYGISGLVGTSSSLGGIRAADVVQLERDSVSGLMRSVTADGYYYVKLLEKNDTQVSFAFLHIPLTEFEKRMDELKEAGSVQEYINITIDQPKAEGEK